MFPAAAERKTRGHANDRPHTPRRRGSSGRAARSGRALGRCGYPQARTPVGSIHPGTLRGDHQGMDTILTPDPAPTPAWRTVLRPLIDLRGWQALSHHLLGLPLGIAYFTWFVTTISLGLGLAITLIGIPILTAALASVRPLLTLERGLANALLGAEIAPLGLAPHGEGWFGRLKAYWTDATSWRGSAYLVARFPIGLGTFIVTTVTFSTALFLIAAPVLAPLDALDFGFWEPDTVLEGLPLVPLGLVVLVASGWISEGMAVLSRELARLAVR
jgi:Putative sensor